MKTPRKSRSPVHPIHWPAWAALGLFRLLNPLPWPVKRTLAAVLGTAIYWVIPIRRRVVLINLQVALPDLTESARRRLARAHYRSLAQGLFETCAAWWSPTAQLPAHEVRGREHLEAAVNDPRGALVLTGHVTLLELGARILNEQFPFSALYRDPKNAAIATIMRRARERHLVHAISADDLRHLIRVLKEVHLVWYAPDQGKLTKMSELVPFLGEPALTNVATSRIAQMSGCQVLPYFAHRAPDHTYVLEFFPPWQNFPSGDHLVDAERVNQFIGEQVRQHPEQYFWVHQRYKRRGPDLPDVYAS